MFEPTIHGKRARAVEFSNILHILDLRSNLLSCSFFTCSKGFEIDISLHTVTFKINWVILFTTLINPNNSEILNRTTITFEVSLSV